MEMYSEIKKQGNIPISVSQLQTFNQCPFKWKMQHIDKIKDKSNSIHLLYGNAIHEAIQSYIEVFYKSTKVAASNLDLRNIFLTSMTDQYQSCEDKSFVTKEIFKEFIQDGFNFIDEFKRRAEFPKRNASLIGVELPLRIDLGNGIIFTAFIDMGIKDCDVHVIYDIKTSTGTWRDDKKKDPATALQVLLYKKFYSEQYNVPLDKIVVKYYIAKRKVYENSAYPQKRIQIFEPPHNKKRLAVAEENLNNFISKAFKDGKYNVDFEFTTCRSPLCQYCHLQKEHCPEWKKK